MTSTITVFGDIHGNIPALESALADMDARGIPAETRYCLGDLVGYGVQPNEVIDIIRDRGYPTLAGNYDEGVGVNSPDCGCAYKTDIARERGNQSIAWTNIHTTEDNKAFLRSLEKHIPVQLGDLRVLLVHGSPRKVNEYMYEDRPDAYFERIFDGVEADVIVCGHTHLPYHKVLPSGRQIVNAGSVGKPKDDNVDGGYVTLRADGDQLSVEFIRFAYDVEAAATLIEAADGMPSAFAQMLRDGKG